MDSDIDNSLKGEELEYIQISMCISMNGMYMCVHSTNLNILFMYIRITEGESLYVDFF